MSNKLTISIGQYSTAGIKDENEDSFGVLVPNDNAIHNKGIAAVIADGMGSCEHAKEASESCVKNFLSDYFSTPDTWSVKKSAVKIITTLNNWLYSRGNNNHVKGMVSTFSAVVFKSTTAHIFHVGNSRIYRLRNGDLELLTTDHRIFLSEEKNYLSRAMGIDPRLDLDYKSIEIQHHDQFIMTTDGIHDYVNDSTIRQLLTASDSIENNAKHLSEYALEQGSHDNITCQIVQIDDLPPQEANEVYKDLTALPFPSLLNAGETLDGYHIVREIYSSPTSQLYLVRDEESAIEYAMKTPSVNYEDDPAYIERFYIEEWAGKRINSPHILKIIEPPRPKTRLYFLMEYLEGQSLEHWIEENPKPDIDEVIRIAKQIMLGLRAFQRMEMLHRDLKPGNIMITKDGTVKIVDFGSVKISGIEEISTPVERQELLGTRTYSAPEYLIGLAGTTKSDLYSLGVIIYEMLTHKQPYKLLSENEMDWRKMCAMEYTPSYQRNHMIPVWLDGALSKAVRCDPRTRYDSYSEFMYDLEHPNHEFMRDHLPLFERNPLAAWKLLSSILFISNLVLFYLLSKS